MKLFGMVGAGPRWVPADDEFRGWCWECQEDEKERNSDSCVWCNGLRRALHESNTTQAETVAHD